MLIQLVEMFLVLLDLLPQCLQFLVLLLPHVQSLAGILTFGEGIAVGRPGLVSRILELLVGQWGCSRLYVSRATHDRVASPISWKGCMRYKQSKCMRYQPLGSASGSRSSSITCSHFQNGGCNGTACWNGSGLQGLKGRVAEHGCNVDDSPMTSRGMLWSG